MANNVIGLYDEAAVADRVIEDLVQSGFDRSSINRFEGGTQDLETELQREGIPADEADYYVDGLRQGGALVSVRADESRTDLAVEIMNRYANTSSGDLSGETTELTSDYDTGAATTGAETTYRESSTRDVGATDTDEARFAIAEEQLRIGKREVQRGGMRVRSYVTETPVEEQVTLRDETIHVDRRPVDRAASNADTNVFEEKTYEFSETDEEAVVSKEARVTEEVVISKDVEQRTETVRDTVRRTDVDIQEVGVDRSRDTDYATFDTDFRSHYEGASSDYTYEQTQPAYRYGYTLANDPRYKGREWNDIEADARRDWESRNEGTWDNFRDSIRHAWEQARGRR